MIRQLYDTLFRSIYSLSWPVALLAPAVVLLLRGAAVFLHPRTEKSRQIFRVLFPVWILVFVSFTLLFRSEHEREAVYEAFVSVKKWVGSGNAEHVRSFWMNVLLGIPGGLCFAGAMADRRPDRPFVSALGRVLPAAAVCFALSLAAEVVQLTQDLGQFETDDLIANTLGGFLGAFPELAAGLLLAILRWKPKNAFLAKLVELLNEYWHVVSYIFWGGTTTFVNWLVFFSLEGRIHYLAANGIARVVSVTFSFLANRAFVFRSGSRGLAILREGLLFAASRLFSLGLETALMWAGVELLHIPQGLVKVVVAMSIAVLNFLVGKFIVFRKKTEPEYEDF
jgi:putative flippase GtrA